MKNLNNYEIVTIELPKHFIGMEPGGAYLLSEGVWVRVIGKLENKLYKVYRSDTYSDLPAVVKEQDRVN